MKAGRSGVGSAGLVGTVLAVCGCLGFPAVIGLLLVLGARWILQPRYLLPILAIGVGLGLWSLAGFFRRSGESLPLVLGLIGSAASLTTEIIRAATHQHAYFLGYPGLVLFIAAFVSSAIVGRPRNEREDRRGGASRPGDIHPDRSARHARLEMKPLIGGVTAGLVASVCCGGSLIFGSIGLGALFSTLGLSRYIPQALGIGALFIAALHYLAYRHLALGYTVDQQTLQRRMLASAAIGLAVMVVGFVVLEWLNHAVIHQHRFLARAEYATALIPGVPNVRLLYAVAAMIIGIGLLWGLPFPSQRAGAATSPRRGLRILVSAAALAALVALVIGTLSLNGPVRGDSVPIHGRQH